ncbi:MAG: hypothetical protein ACK5LZ_05550 [Anaerorhabdus sp.]
MKKIGRQFLLAVEDFWNYKIRLCIVVVVLAVLLVASSFAMHIIVNYEASRTSAYRNYTRNNVLQQVEIHTDGNIANESEILSYLYTFTKEYQEYVLGTVLTSIDNNNVIIGFGLFEDFYNIKYRGENPVQIISYGDPSINNKIIGEYIEETKPIQLISTFGRVLVLPFNELVYVGKFQQLLDIGLDKVTLNNYLQNFIFVNAPQDVVDSFVDDLNSMSDGIFINIIDVNSLLEDNIHATWSQLLIFCIVVLIAILFLCIVTSRIVSYITDCNLKEYTLNLLYGAKLSEVILRVILLNILIVSISVLLACVTLNILQVNQFNVFVFILAGIFIVLFSVYPVTRLLYSDVYSNLRGDFHD